VPPSAREPGRRPACAPRTRVRNLARSWCLADSGERLCFAAVAAGVQPGDQPVPDRDNVIGPVGAQPVPVLIDPRCPHRQYYLVTGGDDLLKLGSQPQVRLLAQRLFQLAAATAASSARPFRCGWWLCWVL
jgi:hypothetical protein